MMTRRAYAAGVAGLLVLCTLIPGALGAQVVDVPDSALAAAIRDALQLTGGPITQAGILELEQLRVVGSGVEELTGLEHAHNLRRLVVGANRIRDLGPLRNLAHLEEVHAWFNDIEDLAPLSEVRTLTHVQLGANRVSDLRPLRRLDRLTYLDVAANDVSDLGPLAELDALRWLELSDNRIGDLTPLRGLTGLRKLWLWRNRVTDVSPLAGLEELRWLELGANGLGDVSSVLSLPRLVTLSVHDNYLDPSDPALVAGLTALRTRGAEARAEPQRTMGFWATSEDGR